MARPNFVQPPPVKIALPVGGLLDIPTGIYIRGMHDQMILLGGIGNVTGIVGPGNSFKTTVMRYMILSALSRMDATVGESFSLSYDTELNISEERNIALSQQFDTFKDRNIVEEGMWRMTDKSIYSGNKFFGELKDYLKEKRDDRKALHLETAFLSRDKVTPLMTMTPSFTDIDSLSKFTTDNVEKILTDTELGSSDANTLYMRQGLAKSRLLMEIPTLAASSMNYFLFTAHIGKEIVIPSGPTSAPPKKQLQHMPQGEIIKGVSNDFFYLLHNCWLVTSARPFLNQGTKAPEYPYEPGDEVAGDLDLNIVTMKQLRGKNGSTGFTIELLVSQKEGVLASLSELHYIKKMGRYGLGGNDRNYHVVLLPDVNMSRTSVRSKLRDDKKLRRAVEIISQLCQLEEHHRLMMDQLMKPEELYQKLTEKGYDWDFLLTQTRSWHTFNDEVHPSYPFSTLDMCRAARGEFHPYWLSDDNKTVKPEYAKKKLQPKAVQ